MDANNYKIVIPLSATEYIEAIPKQYPVPLQNCVYSLHDLKIYVPDTSAVDGYTEILPDQRQYREVQKKIRIVQRGLSRYFDRFETFIIASVTGLRIVRSSQILCFEYPKHQKQWVVVLTDGTKLPLKHNTVANDILEYSTSFTRINHQCIINLNHLLKIEDNKCVLTVETDSPKLIVSRNYLKCIQETIRMI